ncbi:Periplasmic pH-dependent serine endoprotease DegQ [Methylacidimicrobium cyclopophantes]|uniref:Periplasmic pH-dependent serine endoprotease DegQ n=1 Tax=Methylacidimicrobium cyclopophantes TaxID=1041766 RepID=A0A5E6M6Y1_9BACT|nr:serine protease [Methylacidimicrobium cyclopophantes]VVM05309.1 Periplasmic pH-dependent serine endoprotease DegQ [Methylacidimicrobium cyclopophantes]
MVGKGREMQEDACCNPLIMSDVAFGNAGRRVEVRSRIALVRVFGPYSKNGAAEKLRRISRVAVPALSALLAFLPPAGSADGIRIDRNERPNEAIVRVISYQEDGPGIVRMTGTGFFVNAHGQLITNRHLLSRALFCAVLGPDEEPLRVERVLAEAGDLVLVQIALPSGGKVGALPLRKSPPVPGEPIRIEGYPLGIGPTTSSGKVVGFRQRPYQGSRSFEVDAPIFVGNSGGPVLDDRGQVVGVSTFRLREGQNPFGGALCPHVLMEESRIVDLPFADWSRRTRGGTRVAGAAAKGWRALQRGEIQSARHFFLSALRNQPRAPLLNQGLAEALLESGRPKEAALALSTAIEERPKDFLAHLRLASVYRRLGKAESAAAEDAISRRIEGAIFLRIRTEVAAREQAGLPGLWQKARFILQGPAEPRAN